MDMSSQVVNLRQFRKQKARADKEKTAEQNRLSYGRTKAEKQATKARNDKAQKDHAQGRLERPGDPTE
jgi:predicted RNA-binding protein with PUA-like domain